MIVRRTFIVGVGAAFLGVLVGAGVTHLFWSHLSERSICATFSSGAEIEMIALSQLRTNNVADASETLKTDLSHYIMGLGFIAHGKDSAAQEARQTLRRIATWRAQFPYEIRDAGVRREVEDALAMGK